MGVKPLRLLNACSRHLHLSAANNSTVALQVLHDRGAMDPKLAGQRVGRFSVYVVLDQLPCLGRTHPAVWAGFRLLVDAR